MTDARSSLKHGGTLATALLINPALGLRWRNTERAARLQLVVLLMHRLGTGGEMRRYVSRVCGVSVLLALFSTAPVHAAELIDFGTGVAGAGGQIKYGGNGGSLTGSGILIGVMTAMGTPVNNGVQFATGGAPCAFPGLCAELDFTTGALGSYQNGVYSFDPGGSFTITGGIPGAGISNQPLMSGTFSGASVVDGGLLKFNAFGSDGINPILLSYLGIPSGTTFQFVGSVIAANLWNPGASNGGAFDITALSTDFASIGTPAATPTPEPMTVALMAMGGAALFGAKRTQRRRSADSTPAV
jgi:hypothetical protein